MKNYLDERIEDLIIVCDISLEEYNFKIFDYKATKRPKT